MKYWVNYVYFYKDDLSTYFCFLHWSCPLSFVIIQFYCYYWIFCYHFYIHIVWSFLSIDAFNCCSIHEICCLTFDLDTVCFVVYLSVVWAVWMFGVSTQLLQPDVQTWKSGSGCWPHTVIHAALLTSSVCATLALPQICTQTANDWTEMRQIRHFFSSSLLRLNVLKSDVKKSEFVPFGANLSHFVAKSDLFDTRMYIARCLLCLYWLG